MWNALERQGFTGGRPQEHPVDVSNFFGLMPKNRPLAGSQRAYWLVAEKCNLPIDFEKIWRLIWVV